jgi:predicted alpha-1,2-mannosidase
MPHPTRREFLLAGSLACTDPAFAAVGATRPVLRHADPFIGTDGTGHVTPAAAVPFGMVMPGPDHADRGWSYSSGYQWKAARTLGFSNTHISGAGIPELGDVLLMPAAGAGWGTDTADFSAAHDKKTEAARPGFYAVTLPGHGVRAEMTATRRVALHRWRFLRAGAVQVLVDLQHGLHFVDGPRVTQSESAVDAARGEVAGTVHAKNWVEREASFVLRFSQPVRQVRTLPARPGEKAARYLLDFGPLPGRILEARIALSTVDVAGARRNLAEADGIGFERAQREAGAAWQRLLGRLQIDADERTTHILYSALYRTLLHPSDIADADGRVRGPRGRLLLAPGGRYDSTLSLWDTFRAVHPLHTLLVPERVAGNVNSLLAHHRQMGWLPLWTAWGRETYTMIGNPALPVLADAVVKGFDGFNARDVLAAMVETATRDRYDAPPWAQRTWDLYEQFGHLPIDRHDAGEAVSKALEYGIGDDAIARVARLLGESEIAERFQRRAAGWKQLFDASTQTMRGRDSAGRWREPFDPLAATSPMKNPGDYTEANAWQYSATPALHDPLGFRERLGGPDALEAWLDRFFGTPMPNPDKHLGQEAMIGQLAHGNEPSHHIPWLYAFTPNPAKGHALVERIAREFYGTGPDGIVGNDDCGQMGAWFVFAALGLYPVQPASGHYVAGRPLVRSATLALPGGRRLRIERGGAPGLRFNGQALDPTAVPHRLLVQGGTLSFGVGPARPAGATSARTPRR